MIIGNPNARYINSLARTGTVLTNSHGIGHPSQPNYYALFCGKTFRLDHLSVAGDLPLLHHLHADNLAKELVDAHRSFCVFADGIAKGRYRGGNTSSGYVARHNPWANFVDVTDAQLQSIDRFNRSDFSTLPTVSIIIPSNAHDMHDPFDSPMASVAPADSWLKSNLEKYRKWAERNDSLLIITMDESDYDSPRFGALTPSIDPHPPNNIPTIFTGSSVRKGFKSGQNVDHFSLLRTIEDIYGLRHAGHAQAASPIVGIWK